MYIKNIFITKKFQFFINYKLYVALIKNIGLFIIIMVKIDNGLSITTACCVLHNYC
jgi:hypothetical protein